MGEALPPHIPPSTERGPPDIETGGPQDTDGLEVAHTAINTQLTASSSAETLARRVSVAKSMDASYPAQTDLNAKQAIVRQFQVGDLVFTNTPKGGPDKELEDKATAFLQKIRSWIKREKTAKQHTNCVHVAMVVHLDEKTGSVIIAESMPPHGLRFVDLLSHGGLQINKGSAYNYEVMRLSKHTHMAAKAATIATSLCGHIPKYVLDLDITTQAGIAAPVAGVKKNKYSMKLGFLSFFKSAGEDNLKAKKRTFKALAEQIQNQSIPMKGSAPRKFVCSSLVGYILQRAAAAEALEKSDDLHQLSKLLANTPDSSAAKSAAQQHGQRLSEQMKELTGIPVFDAKHTKPYELRDIVSQDDLYTPVLRLVPPPN